MDVATQDRRTQIFESLGKANEYRLAIAAEKKKISQMPRSKAPAYLGDLIENTKEPAILSAQVRWLLGALPGKGPRFVDRAFNELDIRTATRRLRQLTERQRVEMAEFVRTNG